MAPFPLLISLMLTPVLKSTMLASAKILGKKGTELF